MRKLIIIGICAAFLNSGVATAMPVDMTIDRLFDICAAPTVQAAAVKGDELGWRRTIHDAKTDEWRTNFVAYNGGSVDVVDWRREQADGIESLSFWIATGPNKHKACAYSTPMPAGLLDALSERLGKPDNLEKNDVLVSAWWKRGEIVYSFTQVGSSASITIGPNR